MKRELERELESPDGIAIGGSAKDQGARSSFLLLERRGSACCRRGGGSSSSGSSGGGGSSRCCGCCGCCGRRRLPRGRAQRLEGRPAPRRDVAFELRAVGLGEDLVRVGVRVRVGVGVGVGVRVRVGVRVGVRASLGVKVRVRVRVRAGVSLPRAVWRARRVASPRPYAPRAAGPG